MSSCSNSSLLKASLSKPAGQSAHVPAGGVHPPPILTAASALTHPSSTSPRQSAPTGTASTLSSQRPSLTHRAPPLTTGSRKGPGVAPGLSARNTAPLITTGDCRMTISREAQVEHGIVAGIMMMVLEVDGQRQNQYEPKKIHITGRKDQPSLTFRIGNTLCEYLAGLGLRFQGVRLDDDGMLIMVAGHDTEKITLTKHTAHYPLIPHTQPASLLQPDSSAPITSTPTSSGAAAPTTAPSLLACNKRDHSPTNSLSNQSQGSDSIAESCARRLRKGDATDRALSPSEFPASPSESSANPSLRASTLKPSVAEPATSIGTGVGVVVPKVVRTLSAPAASGGVSGPQDLALTSTGLHRTSSWRSSPDNSNSTDRQSADADERQEPSMPPSPATAVAVVMDKPRDCSHRVLRRTPSRGSSRLGLKSAITIQPVYSPSAHRETQSLPTDIPKAGPTGSDHPAAHAVETPAPAQQAVQEARHALALHRPTQSTVVSEQSISSGLSLPPLEALETGDDSLVKIGKLTAGYHRLFTLLNCSTIDEEKAGIRWRQLDGNKVDNFFRFIYTGMCEKVANRDMQGMRDLVDKLLAGDLNKL